VRTARVRGDVPADLRLLGRAGVGREEQAALAGAASEVGVTLALSLLGHSRWDVRAAAARVLGDSGGPECLDDARQALEAEADALARQTLSDAVERLSRR